MKLKILLAALLTASSFYAIAQPHSKPQVTHPPKDENHDPFHKGKVRDIYNLPAVVTITATNYRKGVIGGSSDLNYYVDFSSGMFARQISRPNDPDTIWMIYDEPNHTTLVLNKNKRSGNVLPSIPQMPDKDTATVCSKTGKTKKILGYTCAEYICENKGHRLRTELWVADGLKVSLSKGGERTPFSPLFKESGRVKGLVLSAAMYRNNQPFQKMEVTNLAKKGGLLIKAKDYKIAK